MEIVTLLMQLVDLPAVLLAIGLTQLLRWKLPTPAGGKKFDVAPWLYRWLPIVPLLFASMVVILKDGIYSPTLKIDEAIVRGVLSGMAASYGYRTAKVMIFGKESNKMFGRDTEQETKPAEPKPDEPPTEVTE